MHRHKKNIHPSEVRRIINSLKQADLAKLSPTYLRDKINALTISYAHTTPLFPPSWGVFSRAIKYPEKPKNKSQLTYPPSRITELGRANRKEKPVFYCSGNPKATFFELELEPGNNVVLSKWKLTKEIPITLLGYTNKVFQKLCSERDCPNIIPDSVKHPNESRKSNLLINDFFAEAFTVIVEKTNKTPYLLTSLIAEKSLSIERECGIAYPTIAMQANAENFALTTAAADNCLELISAKWYRIDEINNLKYTVTPLAFANTFDSDGTINWQPVEGDEKIYL